MLTDSEEINPYSPPKPSESADSNSQSENYPLWQIFAAMLLGGIAYSVFRQLFPDDTYVFTERIEYTFRDRVSAVLSDAFSGALAGLGALVASKQIPTFSWKKGMPGHWMACGVLIGVVIKMVIRMLPYQWGIPVPAVELLGHVLLATFWIWIAMKSMNTSAWRVYALGCASLAGGMALTIVAKYFRLDSEFSEYPGLEQIGMTIAGGGVLVCGVTFIVANLYDLSWKVPRNSLHYTAVLTGLFQYVVGFVVRLF